MSKQVSTGNLHGTVTNTWGVALPGVTLTLNGPAAPFIDFTNAQGEYRVLELQPGIYQVNAQLQGYKTVTVHNVQITAARNTVVNLVMTAAVEDTEAPIGTAEQKS
jgi:hypothetical protein